MKRYFLIPALLLIVTGGFAQAPKKKPAKQATSQSEMDKMMDEMMKAEGMTEAEKAEMKKMMKGVMPELAKKPGPALKPFTNNKKLVPVKDDARINSISKKAFTDADVSTSAAQLYNKLIAKIPAAEKNIITRVQAEVKDGNSLMAAAVTSLMQGHSQAAMGLAMKAVQADPKNIIYQNNLAAILSQSGYPENAIPFLKKLSRQIPGNSTVLHNLGYAWLNLGEIDTAKKYFGHAAMRNPNNPETKLCRGLIDELKGDPKKAADNYVESFEELPNPFAESMAQNAGAGDRLGKTDFDKLKMRVTIHEYFKKDWIKIPVLSDNVSSYENDMSIKNGYQQMFEDLDAKLELMLEASMEEINVLAEKGESEFVATMMDESIKGLNMMSMSAVYVQKILSAWLPKWMEDYQISYMALMEEIRAKGKQITKAGKDDKCPDFDRKNNLFMVYANPLIRRFHAKKIEEFRTWINTSCTWSWYITGNPKNVILTQCITWTNAFAKLYQTAINDQLAYSKSFVQQNGDRAGKIEVPAIPNFTCPAVVNIPFGLDEIRLANGAVNFDDNSWGIKQSETGGIPNVTISLGVGKSNLTEAGKYGNPYFKTGNGSIATSGFNNADSDGDQQMPITKILEELAPRTKIPGDESAPLDPGLMNASNKLTPVDAARIRRAEMARKLLNEMMSTRCPGELPPKNTRKKKFEVGIGELTLEPPVGGLEGEVWDEEKRAWVRPNGDYWSEDEECWYNSKGEKKKPLDVTTGELEMEPYDGQVVNGETWNEKAGAWVNSKGEYRYKSGLVVGLGPLQFDEVVATGPQPVITNGLQVMETVGNFIKGLFK